VYAYDYSLGLGRDVEHARATVVVAMTLASVGILAALSALRTRASRVVAAASLALAVVLVQVPALATRVHLSPLHADDWAFAALPAAVVCLPLALARIWRARRGSVRVSPSHA
jgi:Ca2+-transporting ATPase